MRRTALSLLLVLALLAGCSKPLTAPAQPTAPPGPKVEGVTLADLDLANAPTLAIQRTDAAPGNGPAPDLTDVVFTNATDGYAVTRGGVIAKSRDGGSTWTPINQLQGGRFSRVEAVDGQTVFAVAQTGCDPGPNCEGPNVLLRTTDGGQNWNSLEPQLPPIQILGGTNPLFPWLSFRFLSAQVGYAAGDINENHLVGNVPLLVTRDGGQTWALVKLPDGLSYTGGYSFVSPERGYVTAVRGGTGEYQVLTTADGGKSWQSLYTTQEFGLFAVDFPTAQDGYIGGGLNPKTERQPRQVMLTTHDGGKSWAVVSRVEDRGSPVVRLHMSSPTEGWAARGGCWSMGGNGPCGGPLLFTRDGGKTWLDTGHGVGRIRAAGRQAWAIDDRGGASTLWRTSDGGATWQQIARPDAVRVTHVQFLDPQVGFIGTNFGFYQTVDGGKSWTPHPLAGQFGQYHWPLFLDPKTAVCVDCEGGLRRSTDGGQTWQKVTAPLPDEPIRISTPALAMSGTTQAGVTEAWMTMRSTTCMNPDCPGFLINSQDGGATWQQLQPGPPVQVQQMAFADSVHGVGLPYGNKLLVSADGGKNWTVQLAPKGLNLYHGSYAGSANNLWLSGTYTPGDFTSQHAVLHSTDGGQHWVAFKANHFTIRQIQFVNARAGWVLGGGADSSGLLATHDGGRTWSEVWPLLPAR